VELNAVTAGHNLQDLMKLVGTVRLILSHVSIKLSPDSKACMPSVVAIEVGSKDNLIDHYHLRSRRDNLGRRTEAAAKIYEPV